MAASVPLTAVQITDADLLRIEESTVEQLAIPVKSYKHATAIFFK